MTQPNFQPRRVLVTGGAGFIGSNYIRYQLSRDPLLVIVDLDRLTYAGTLDNLGDLPDPSRHSFVQGDICDLDLVTRLFREHDIDTVVHFAAESHVDRSIDGPAEFVRTNVVGTFTLLDAARRHWFETKKLDGGDCRFHHISTDEVYGTLGRTDPAFHESTAYAPNSPYSAAKAGADHLARAYFHTYGLPVITTNCSNNYGPRQHREKLLPTVIRSCFLDQPIPVYGDGSNVRDWLYVEDHCHGLDSALRRGRLGECYNIGGNCEQANIDLVRTLCQAFDGIDPRDRPREELITFVEDRPGHDWRYAVDTSKIARDLDWSPITSLEKGLRQTIRWYLADATWRERAGEGGERLGLGGNSTVEERG